MAAMSRNHNGVVQSRRPKLDSPFNATHHPPMVHRIRIYGEKNSLKTDRYQSEYLCGIIYFCSSFHNPLEWLGFSMWYGMLPTLSFLYDNVACFP